MYWIDGNHKSQTIRLLLTLGSNFAMPSMFNLVLSPISATISVLRVLFDSFSSVWCKQLQIYIYIYYYAFDFFEAPNILRCLTNTFRLSKWIYTLCVYIFGMPYANYDDKPKCIWICNSWPLSLLPVLRAKGVCKHKSVISFCKSTTNVYMAPR